MQIAKWLENGRVGRAMMGVILEVGDRRTVVQVLSTEARCDNHNIGYRMSLANGTFQVENDPPAAVVGMYTESDILAGLQTGDSVIIEGKSGVFESKVVEHWPESRIVLIEHGDGSRNWMYCLLSGVGMWGAPGRIHAATAHNLEVFQAKANR